MWAPGKCLKMKVEIPRGQTSYFVQKIWVTPTELEVRKRLTTGTPCNHGSEGYSECKTVNVPSSPYRGSRLANENHLAARPGPIKGQGAS